MSICLLAHAFFCLVSEITELSSVDPEILCNKAQVLMAVFQVMNRTKFTKYPTTGLPANNNSKPILWSRILSVILPNISSKARCFEFLQLGFTALSTAHYVIL